MLKPEFYCNAHRPFAKKGQEIEGATRDPSCQKWPLASRVTTVLFLLRTVSPPRRVSATGPQPQQQSLAPPVTENHSLMILTQDNTRVTMGCQLASTTSIE